MKNITDELEKRNAVLCVRYGSIYADSSQEDYWGNNCSTCGEGKGYFNWVAGCLHEIFWGSPAAHRIAKEFNKEE